MAGAMAILAPRPRWDPDSPYTLSPGSYRLWQVPQAAGRLFPLDACRSARPDSREGERPHNDRRPLDGRPRGPRPLRAPSGPREAVDPDRASIFSLSAARRGITVQGRPNEPVGDRTLLA